jgi:hypothetical protein
LECRTFLHRVTGEDEDKDEDLPAMITVCSAALSSRPSLASHHPCKSLWWQFGGIISRPIGKPALRSQVVLEESLSMELLAAEHSDEEPDTGALEGSGDDFEE